MIAHFSYIILKFLNASLIASSFSGVHCGSYMEFGAGITAEVNDNVELSLGYEGKFREDYQDHTGLINAKYKF